MTEQAPPVRTAIAFAPASIGNLAVGYDLLGLAIEGVGDRVTAVRVDNAPEPVRIRALRASDTATSASALPLAVTENTAGIAAASLWRDIGAGYGIELEIDKGIALGSGMGGSAASAVAGAMAANALLPEPLPRDSLLSYAIEGERYASKAVHADNVAPSLFGGLTLCPARLQPRVVSLPPPSGIVSIVVHPDHALNTADARRALSSDCPLATAVEQQGYLAGFVSGCFLNDRELITRCLRDILIEPQRSRLVPGFDAVKRAALRAGALGCSLSGSGPSVFAWAETLAAPTVGEAMRRAFLDEGLTTELWVSSLNARGATVTVS